jgi:hypothetical protein
VRGLFAAWLCLLAVLCAVPAYAGTEVARLLFSDGVITAQSPNEAVRLLGKTSVLVEGDVLTTGERSFAILEFGDGARMTLRPNTSFAIARYNLSSISEPQNIVLQLFKGGLRAITGLVGKRDPQSMRIITPTSTIGIRGTSFDARLCQGDCQGEHYKTPGEPAVQAAPVLARVQTLWGKGSIVGIDHSQRALGEGVALYAGDVVQTVEKSAATLVFVDQTRVTLNASTRFEVTSYRYAKVFGEQGAKSLPVAKQGQNDNVAFRLVQGSLRLFTGLIGKANPDRFKMHVATSTIGIRGTGFDLNCTDACAAVPIDTAPEPASAAPAGAGCSTTSTPVEPPAQGTGLFASTWDGTISIATGACQVLLPKGMSAFVNPLTGETVPLSREPDFMRDGQATRPDQMQVDYEGFFGFMPLEEASYGLYTYVREGGIRIGAGDKSLDVSPGQAGYAKEGSDVLGRLSQVPAFILNDPYPLPDSFSPSNQSVIDLVSENILGVYNGNLARCSIR